MLRHPRLRQAAEQLGLHRPAGYPRPARRGSSRSCWPGVAAAAPIDRHALVSRHNPTLRAFDTGAPLSVGNGELAFTADATGLQTFADAYDAEIPPARSRSGLAQLAQPRRLLHGPLPFSGVRVARGGGDMPTYRKTAGRRRSSWLRRASAAPRAPRLPAAARRRARGGERRRPRRRAGARPLARRASEPLHARRPAGRGRTLATRERRDRGARPFAARRQRTAPASAALPRRKPRRARRLDEARRPHDRDSASRPRSATLERRLDGDIDPVRLAWAPAGSLAEEARHHSW